VGEAAEPLGRPTGRAGNVRTSLTLRVDMEDVFRVGGASSKSLQVTQGDLASPSQRNPMGRVDRALLGSRRLRDEIEAIDQRLLKTENRHWNIISSERITGHTERRSCPTAQAMLCRSM
jgi:hypothetical protein